MPKFISKIPTAAPVLNVMVGVAGHIDHGKTELVKMLTGCDTDRLKEEKERGMSIELGYAPCYVESGRFGVVDVPGHERFVRKMVAGATGVDLALLVIAADDGVMPQTREHLDILELLGVRQLLVALNKIDLVSADRIEEARLEIEQFLLTTSYPGASITPVSALTGDGLDVLRKRLQEEVDGVNRRKTDGLFRMAIDRVFSSPGHGAVITGIVSSGAAHIGDVVEILPIKKTSRIRGLQVFLSDSNEAFAGQCAALNLPSIHSKEVERGFTASTPDFFTAYTTFTVHLQASRFLENPLTNAARIRFHTGTFEALGKLRLLHDDVLEAGQETFAQIQLDRPVCAFLRDRFILRQPSPANTVAGGVILDCSPIRARRRDEVTLRRLMERWRALDANEDLLLSLLNESALVPKSVNDLSKMAGFTRNDVETALSLLKTRGDILQKSETFIVSLQGFKQACSAVLSALGNLHKANPLRYSFPIADIAREWKENNSLLQEALIRLVDEGKVWQQEGAYRATNAPKLDPTVAALAETVEKILHQERFQTSSPKELAERLRKPVKLVEAALRVLTECGRARRLAEGVYLHDEHVQWAKNQLVEAIRRDGFYETHLFKNLIGSSRKYAIPLLDYFDAIALTRRDGGKRYLCEK